ncbi:hypothetical protein ABT358_02280 [Streptomyces sp. NPDC000341]|uniref:hypothetical protein n=1 Tax=Streptomyces sp. NPDC000341 TaxID=3156645 RepID=UPI00331F6693
MSEYTPSAEVQAAIKDVENAESALKESRERLYAAVAEDLKANPELTNAAAAEKLPFTQETVRVIARRFDVPRKRKPTVKAIKAAKRTGGSGLFGGS